MRNVLLIERHSWFDFLTTLLNEADVFVPVQQDKHIEYKKYTGDNTGIIYNKSIPVTPLKAFVLPFKENVVNSTKNHNKKIITGVPACDLAGLSVLDRIYLDDRYPDPWYKSNRDNILIVGTDCYQIAENCHCTSYGLAPYPKSNADIILSDIDGKLMLEAITDSGSGIFSRIKEKFLTFQVSDGILDLVEKRRKETATILHERNSDLPEFNETASLITESSDEIWEKYSSTCVSCGACAIICPTCTCFLLVDRPHFEKIRQTDACQYPGFGRIAAGEDPLHEKHVRFRNRYLCKYIWKPENLGLNACTGCGRCIDCCPGEINKNEIFLELTGKTTAV